MARRFLGDRQIGEMRLGGMHLTLILTLPVGI